MARTSEPFSFDGHGINAADGGRIAKMSGCGVIPKSDENGKWNPEFDRVGNLLASAPELSKRLNEAIDLLIGAEAWLKSSGQPMVAKGLREWVETKGKLALKATRKNDERK